MTSRRMEAANPRTSNGERGNRIRTSRSAPAIKFWKLAAPCLSILISLVSIAIAPAASLGSGEEKLVLSPPHAEIPPTFWEQYGAWVVVISFLFLALLVLIVAWRLRPRPPVVIPIEVQTRTELEALRQQPQNGRALSEISRTLRRYLIGAFDLPAGEMTTAEFHEALGRTGRAGTELAVRAIDFLRRCDESKFAPDAIPEISSAADRALELVEAGEQRRRLLKEAAAQKPPVIS